MTIVVRLDVELRASHVRLRASPIRHALCSLRCMTDLCLAVVEIAKVHVSDLESFEVLRFKLRILKALFPHTES